MGKLCYRLNVETKTRVKIEHLFRETKDARQRERLKVLRLACTGQHNLADMAQEVGRSITTVLSWLNKFKREGLEAMLVRRKPGARASNLHQPGILEELAAEVGAGNFRTAGEMVAWLQSHHGIRLTIWGAYYWLKKLGAKLKVRRPPRKSLVSGKRNFVRT